MLNFLFGLIFANFALAKEYVITLQSSPDLSLANNPEKLYASFYQGVVPLSVEQYRASKQYFYHKGQFVFEATKAHNSKVREDFFSSSSLKSSDILQVIEVSNSLLVDIDDTLASSLANVSR
jgi:hypothetical protein